MTLSFSGKPETLVVPFSAVTQFSDPSVGFGLQFGALDGLDEENDAVSGGAIQALEQVEDTLPVSDETAEIVSLDSFRKKPKDD